MLAVVIGLVATSRLNAADHKSGRAVAVGRTALDSTATRREAPSSATSTNAARLLPSASATIDRLVTYDTPADSTYQQLYLGTRPANPPELLVASIDASQHRSGSFLLSQSVARSHPVTVGSIRAHLGVAPGRTFLWWTEPDGVEVDVTGTNLTTSEVVGTLRVANPFPTARLGLDIAGPLPAHLHLVSSALTNQPRRYLEELDYHQGTCAARLDVYNNVEGQADVTSGTIRSTTFSGRQALLNTDHNSVSLVWMAVPGLTAQLAARTPACDVTTLAQQVHRVSAPQWATTFTGLGTKAQHLSTTQELR